MQRGTNEQKSIREDIQDTRKDGECNDKMSQNAKGRKQCCNDLRQDERYRYGLAK
jgi:hypothetical protein